MSSILAAGCGPSYIVAVSVAGFIVVPIPALDAGVEFVRLVTKG